MKQLTSRSGLIVAEGTSDAPLADLVESLFAARDAPVTLSRPDFSRLDRVNKDVASRLQAGNRLLPVAPDVVVVHRDADNAGRDARLMEIVSAACTCVPSSALVPVIPIRMTEAWLLLDEAAIRFVAGNPRGRTPLLLPKPHEVEGTADPKQVLHECLLRAASVTGRKRQQLATRFPQNRRQLLQRLDPDGPVCRLTGWQALLTSVDSVVAQWSGNA